MRLKETCQMAGIEKTTAYKLMNEGAFPRPVTVGGRAVRWVSTEIEAWIMDRMEERDGEAVASGCP
ncbi:MAG: AlpA family phage regulatory protein [Alcanivoracaceae bacterium]|nr:AlpA family phage regulatory protein [Alcanivoracaceae bacterium]